MMDLVDSLAFKRWVEYYKWSNMDGIDWPTFRDAYNLGIIR